MPRKTKRWIDPKKSVKYEVVERSTDDVLSSTSGVAPNVLRIVNDQRPQNRQSNTTQRVGETQDGEQISSHDGATSSHAKRPHRPLKNRVSSDIFEDDDEPVQSKKSSMFSDDEGGDSFSDGDDGSSGIGSEDDLPDDDDLDEESAMHVRTAAPREAGWVQTKSKPKSSRPFVRGGYDYGQHMKESGAKGAVFVSKEGRVSTVGEEEEANDSSAAKKGVGPQLLPAELFASKPSKEAVKADAHDKLFGAMEDVDPEIQAMLDSSSSEGDTEDRDGELDDDFVLQAIKPVEGEQDEMDVRAYLDNIIRTGRLPHELDDPFGDDALEDIDELLSGAPQKKPTGGAGKHAPKHGSKPGFKPSASSLDDIDDDVDAVVSRMKSGGAKKSGGNGAKSRVRFEEDDEEDEEMEEYDSDIFDEDEDDGDVNSMARKMGAIPGGAPLTAGEAARALHKFETALAEYEETMEMDEDDPLAKGSMDVNDFADVLDEFMDEAVVLGLRPATSKAAVARQQAKDEREGKKEKKKRIAGVIDAAAFATAYGLVAERNGEYQGSDSEEEYDVHLEGKEQPQWDVESYLSTYTDTDNHPRVITHSVLDRRIQIGRGGVPTGVLQHERKRMAKSERAAQRAEDEAALAARDSGRTNFGVARPKTETPEERKARKEALKLEKKVSREVKKELKTSFRQESTRQQRQLAGDSRATIVHL